MQNIGFSDSVTSSNLRYLRITTFYMASFLIRTYVTVIEIVIDT